MDKVDPITLSPDIFWLITIIAGALFTTLGFVLKHLFTDFKQTLQGVSSTMALISKNQEVSTEKLNNQREAISLMREDFKTHVEHILREYESVSDEIDMLKEKHNSLQQEIKLLSQAFVTCQNNCLGKSSQPEGG